WHWFWDFGNGDMGNQGVHQMDVVHWSLPPGSKYPRSVISAGGRFKYKDQGQVPNTLISMFDYDGIPAIFETRGLQSDHLEGVGIGNIIVLEAGEIRGSTGKPQFFPRENGKISRQARPLPDVEYHIQSNGKLHDASKINFRNFIEAILADDMKKQNAPGERAFY